VITYDVAPGEVLGTVTSITEERGDCGGGYVSLDDKDPAWAVSVAVGESPGDLGRVLVEASIQVAGTSDAFVSNQLGFGLRHVTTLGSPSEVRFPFRDDGAGPVDTDMVSLETLELAPKAEIEPVPAEVTLSAACCYPRPARPELR
jgi:hypothetical protein